MRFQTPCISSNSKNNFISSKIQFITNPETGYQSVISLSRIPANEIILFEYPCATLYGELDIDRGLQVIMKYIILAEQNDKGIKNLYPRDNDLYTFPRTSMIKEIHKIIKSIPNNKKNLKTFFAKYNKIELEFYYAKYIFNAFEGYSYGPLTLPYVAKFNHSCKSNIIFNFDTNSGSMIVKTTKDILCGEELFISYLFNKKILNHKEYLANHYGFTTDCKC
jgi:hypothetical protein